MSDPLEAALLSAHARGDKAALVGLYENAAHVATSETARAFFLTHAYVFALDCGDARASSLRKRLVDLGRETPN